MTREIALPKRRNIADRKTWHGMAFIMEALVLLVFLILSMSVLLQLFGAARSHNENASALSYSVILASNEAERFNVDPSTDNSQYYTVDEDGNLALTDEADSQSYLVTRTVVPQQEQNGILYYATITVEQQGKVVYEMDSARYVGNSEVIS